MSREERVWEAWEGFKDHLLPEDREWVLNIVELVAKKVERREIEGLGGVREQAWRFLGFHLSETLGRSEVDFPTYGPPHQFIGAVALLRTLGPTAGIGEALVRMLDISTLAANAQALVTRDLSALGGTKWVIDHRWVLDAADRAEGIVPESGFRFDHDTGSVFALSSGQGRPKRLLTGVLGSVWEDEQPKYEAETGDTEWNSIALRKRLVESAQWFLPLEWQDPEDRHGTIATALGNYLRNPERYLPTPPGAEEPPEPPQKPPQKP